MTDKKWGLNVNKCRWLLKSIICPIITYGSIVWASPDRHINLNRVARPLLMSCGTFFRTTPTEALWVIFDIMPFDIKARTLAAKARRRTNSALIRTWDGVGNPGLGHQRKLDWLADKPMDVISTWGLDIWRQRWMEHKGLRQAKSYLSDIGPNWLKYLCKRSRPEVRTIVGFLTGHFTFNKHLKLIGIADNSICRFCREEDEDSDHLIWRCPTFEQRRTSIENRYSWFTKMSIHIGNLMNQQY